MPLCYIIILGESQGNGKTSVTLKRNAVVYHYTTVNFLESPHNKHPESRPLGKVCIVFCDYNCDLSLQWRHNWHNGVSNHQPHDCLRCRLFSRRSYETSKLRVTGLCEGNSPMTGEFPAQRASNAEEVSIWWRHHVECLSHCNAVCNIMFHWIAL